MKADEKRRALSHTLSFNKVARRQMKFKLSPPSERRKYYIESFYHEQPKRMCVQYFLTRPSRSSAQSSRPFGADARHCRDSMGGTKQERNPSPARQSTATGRWQQQQQHRTA